MDRPEHTQKSDKRKPGLTRRTFLKGMGVTSFGIAALPGGGLLERLRGSGILPSDQKILGPEPVALTLRVNGQKVRTTVAPQTTLAEALRDQLHLTGTKIGCDRGACGACTVILAGQTVNSCMTLALDAVGHDIQTVEGLEAHGKLHAIQQAFIEHDGMQCGFCTSGMLMSCKHLLDTTPNPTLAQVKVATSGNLCRCGTYPKVFEAVLAAGRKQTGS